ncbi:hypothetical protein CRENBAI_008364 [Crenichthys baileyi]|uniref:Uncharacterized protein n=1 Tax=Crenichthys baileyi TaxID=28760 RepID=A0AAV9SL42_9TELE
MMLRRVEVFTTHRPEPAVICTSLPLSDVSLSPLMLFLHRKTHSLFSFLTSEWVPQKYPPQLSFLPHFSISPKSTTPLALFCQRTSLSRGLSVLLVALGCKEV